MILDYKNFYKNYEYIYDKCEDYFDIKINKEKRSFLNQKYNIIDIYIIDINQKVINILMIIIFMVLMFHQN